MVLLLLVEVKGDAAASDDGLSLESLDLGSNAGLAT